MSRWAVRYAAAAADGGATRALAHPAHALLPLCAAVGVAGAGPAIGYTPAAAHTIHALLPLRAAVGAAPAVPLVGLKVYAPHSAASLAFRAAANLVISAPDAVLRAALGVPTTFPAQTPATVRPGHPWYGRQRGS